MGREPTVIGIAGHNGWVVSVCISVRDGGPVVIDRRRVELIEPGLPNQPYHHETLEMDAARAEELVRKVRESALRCAERGLAQLRSSLGAEREIVAIAMREGVLPRMPGSVAEAHASYPVLVRADAMLYHDALSKAASALPIDVEFILRGEEHRRAAEALSTSAQRLDRWLVGLRDSLGPPWQKDHRDATARAIAALGKHAALKLS